MLTCKYCATEVTEYNFCPFCLLTFPDSEISFNYERPSIFSEEIPTGEDLAWMGTEKLLAAKTHFLYYALRQARQSRKNAFENLKDKDLFVLYQKKCYIIENILLERTGTFPKRIDNKLLDSINKKSMKNELFHKKRVMKLCQNFELVKESGTKNRKFIQTTTDHGIFGSVAKFKNQ